MWEEPFLVASLFFRTSCIVSTNCKNGNGWEEKTQVQVEEDSEKMQKEERRRRRKRIYCTKRVRDQYHNSCTRSLLSNVQMNGSEPATRSIWAASATLILLFAFFSRMPFDRKKKRERKREVSCEGGTSTSIISREKRSERVTKKKAECLAKGVRVSREKANAVRGWSGLDFYGPS